MIEVNYSNNDYKGLSQMLIRSFGLQPEGDIIRLPKNIGEGFVMPYNLPEGISVIVSDTVVHDNLYFHRQATATQHYFIIQFNESFSKGDDQSDPETNEQHVYNIRKNAVLLTSSLMESKFLLPKGVRIRSVRIIIGSDLLNNFIGSEITDKFLSNYFSMLLKNRNPEIIGTDYRVLMDELIREKIDHPLRMKFIYNRVMLMIEKLVTGFIAKLENNNQFIKLKDDEINRLIRVESLLVKDYSGAPPTIAALSKIAAMSPTKLKRDFKAMYGLPIYEYYQKNRMIRARSLLLEGKYAVKEVGIMVGYSNLGHFAGSFRKEFGLLPSEIVNEETGNYASAKDIQPHDWSKN
ncbi:helix-turn-helix transcriptional regulator [Panacibacter sp. DH6]|uniref:Helix-turn-helix transcriptional regulator n=1 Tax=Panacibacter microcysteis TaxID=2793269 RepID=A0A931GZN6_9BACT|nr:helix-turn-helix transcriptional regulator [Panacibacter microcysteis]